ncbi:MAG TPA: type I restriction endonuclease [Bacteroidales bacterium]|nr:type I restriction endonuclease [Bacteroidales bacterium]
MDLKDQIKQLAERVTKLKSQIQTEEATKMAFIVPFIQCLGYDIFNPLEVVPEFISDIGIKKGEKIDYAILKDGQPIILIECKHWVEDLNIHDGQLLRYFNVSKAKFAILTNGIIYRFYTDLVKNNLMDEKPFFEFDITEIKDNQVDELKKFHKSYFDIEKIFNAASDLKYSNEIKNIFFKEINEPSEALVRFFVTQVYQGRATEKVLITFKDLVRKSCQEVITDMITERLKTAIKKESEAAQPKEAPIQKPESEPPKSKIETTIEEMEAFYIIKAIIRRSVDIKRIAYRDTQSYFSVLLDDNNRKPVCRLYFSEKKKQIGTFDENRKEIYTTLQSVDDIYNFSDILINTVKGYEGK